MVKCAKFAGREASTCTRGRACHCLNELSGNSGKLDSMIRAYADDAGMSVAFVRGSLAANPNGEGLIRWGEFCRIFIAGANAAIKAIEESQPPDTTPWDCVDAVRKKLGIEEPVNDH